MKKDLPLSYEEQLRKDCPAVFKMQEAFGSDFWDDSENIHNKQYHGNPPDQLFSGKKRSQDYGMQKRSMTNLRKFDPIYGPLDSQETNKDEYEMNNRKEMIEKIVGELVHHSSFELKRIYDDLAKLREV